MVHGAGLLAERAGGLMDRFLIVGECGFFCSVQADDVRWGPVSRAWKFLSQDRAWMVAQELEERSGLELIVVPDRPLG